MKISRRTAEPVQATDLLRAMRDHHLEIARSLGDLLECSYAGNPSAMRDAFAVVERELRSHLDTEERLLLPAFAREHPVAAVRAREEHAVIRRRLEDLGLALELHVLRADMLEDFADLLNRHAAGEELSLYRCTDTSLPAQEREALETWIRARMDARRAPTIR